MSSPDLRRALAALATLVCAQAATTQVAQTARRVFARAQELRGELLSDFLDASADRRRVVAETCTELSSARPLEPLVEAVLQARGVAVDDAARLRGSLIAIVAPEVVDLDRFDAVHVTMQLPRLRESTAEVEFRCRLVDSDGVTVQEGVIGPDRTSIDDLMRVRATTALSVVDLDDGDYSVRIEALVDGEGPGDGEPGFVASVTVMRGFGEQVAALPLFLHPFAPGARERADASMQILAELAKKIESPAARAAYLAAYRAVDRAFRGEPRLPSSAALAELACYHDITRRLRVGGAPYAGLEGRRLTIGLPVPQVSGSAAGGGETDAELLITPTALVSVELPAADAVARPLVLMMAGAPSWDGGPSRIDAVGAEHPEWLLDRLRRAGFDLAEHWVAIVESPGRIASPILALPEISRQLTRMLPVDGVYWVGEREGAYCVARAACRRPDLVDGIVLVAGGSLSNPDLEALGDTRVLLVGAHGHVSTRFLDELATRAADRSADVIMLPDTDARPWPIALGAAAREIEAFIRR